ncbi:hypothetical protein AYI68_g5560 [Smittium mucronatum]|uniref:Uncharacterized protein n=1 Tax=Smittium mucronatum TaxID=133383 RepID=A0A1R0GTX4_9FUNG|nr:hypothetical protein AYI68_g5560 [Smittium mucronatum]
MYLSTHYTSNRRYIKCYHHLGCEVRLRDILIIFSFANVLYQHKRFSFLNILFKYLKQFTISEDKNDNLNELTALVRKLIRKREPQLEEEGPFNIPKVPITELSVYAELSEALPSIEKKFFRTPLSDEDRKTALYKCLKTCYMFYFPPPLNESEPNAVKKLYSTLYAIQTALTQATITIDYYEHRKIQDNPGIIVTDDPDITFAKIMRILLFDIATSVTQNRLYNRHKGMELPRRVKHIRNRHKSSDGPGCLQFISCKSSADITPAAEQEEVNQGSEDHSNEGSIGPAAKTRHRGSTATKLETYALTGPEKTQFTSRGSEFQNLNPEIDMLHDTQEGLSHFFRPTKFIYANPGMQEMQEIPSIPTERMGQIQGNVGFSKPIRFADPWETKEVCTKNTALVYFKLSELGSLAKKVK